jgi:hypothetical protein
MIPIVTGQTYSHVTSSATMRNNDHGRDDVPASDTGLLMMPRVDDPKTTSYSLNVATPEGTRTTMEDDSMPQHSIPIPTEMPEHIRPTPALKLWPLAVLVFYSESSCMFLLVSARYQTAINSITLRPSVSPNHYFECNIDKHSPRRERWSIWYRTIHPSGWELLRHNRYVSEKIRTS